MNSDIVKSVCEITEENVMNYADVVKLSLDIGEHMLMSGGEVDRVEDTISRICNSYGSHRTDVFSITSLILVTADFGEGHMVTQTRRVPGVSRNFDKLGALNDLSRRICRHEMSFEEAQKMTADVIIKKKKSQIKTLLGSLLAAGGFAVFFGGSLRDCAATMIAAVIIFLIDKYVYTTRINQVVYYMLASFVAGVVSIVTVYVGIGQNIDMIMIGCIMLVIPGINFTSAVEDVLVGDTATGTLKLCEAVLMACAIAGGFGFSVYLCGGLNLI
jgi:uncharacterized membrane protein YjjP (DUF1212 family)